MTAGAASAAGCAGVLPNVSSTAEPGDFDIDGFLRRLDEELAEAIRNTRLERAIPSQQLAASPRAQAYVRRANPIARRAICALHFAGVYRELPDHVRQDPRIERRKQEMSPTLDRSVTEVTALLASMSDAQLARLRHSLESHPNAVMAISEVLDREAKGAGVPLGSRLKLRTAATEIAFRLRKQPPKLLIEEYVGKVHRVAAQRGIDLRLQQEAATEAMRRMFWAEPGPNPGSVPTEEGSTVGDAPVLPKERPARDASETGDLEDRLRGATSTASVSRSSSEAEALPLEVPRASAPRHGTSTATRSSGAGVAGEDEATGNATVTTGLVISGVGMAVLIVGGVLTGQLSPNIPGLVVITVGAVLLLIGLTVLIVGAVSAASTEAPAGA